MLHEHKKKLYSEEKKDLLMEVIKEENEIKHNLKNIIFWMNNSASDNLKKINIISNSKSILHILGKLSDEIHNEFKAPDELTELSHNIHGIKTNHLAKLFKENNEIEKTIKAILRNITHADFRFNKQNSKLIYDYCEEIFKELGSDATELRIALDMAKEMS